MLPKLCRRGDRRPEAGGQASLHLSEGGRGAGGRGEDSSRGQAAGGRRQPGAAGSRRRRPETGGRRPETGGMEGGDIRGGT